MIVMEKSYSSTDVCGLTGVTYRILDNWARLGVITPEVKEANGSGTRRAWSWRQIEHLDTMWRVHQYLIQFVGERGVSVEIMHSLAFALDEGRPWLVGASVDAEGNLEIGDQF